MARSLSSLTLVMKTILLETPWLQDPRVLNLPWREYSYQEIQSRPLVVGLLLDDGVVKVHPPVERALKEVADKLRAAGHDIMPWYHDGLHEKCIAIMVNAAACLSPDLGPK
jgi:amidase